VEIVSPSNTADQIEAKLEDYHLHGAKEVWVLYPERRHLCVYAAEISAQRHSGSLVSQLLNGEVLNLDAIFAD
jgi:Uma2 family endonuclease